MKKTKLSPTDKGFVIAGSSLILGTIIGVSLIMIIGFAGLSEQTPIVIILGLIAIVLYSVGILFGCVLQINVRSHERNKLKSDLRNEQNRLLRILNDQEI